MEPGLDAVPPGEEDSPRRVIAAHTDPSLVTAVAAFLSDAAEL